MKTRRKIIDYISGNEILAYPEETEAVQPYSKILVEDYNYPKDLIITHPQYRVKIRPSDKNKSYPVDIAIFEKTINDDNLKIIVECKQKREKEGLEQLKNYLRFSDCNIGVFYNGQFTTYIRKIENKGKIKFMHIPDIPKYLENIDSIGLYYKKDLQITHNLKAIFKEIRNYWAANSKRKTNDIDFAKQILNILFCKIYDEKYTDSDKKLSFRYEFSESQEREICVKRIQKIFTDVKAKWSDVFDISDNIDVDTNSLCYVVAKLQKYSLLNAKRDVVADAFEIFIGKSLKGEQGQFFTPRNVVDMCVKIMNPNKDDKIIDPACGSGGFLSSILKYVSKGIDDKFVTWTETALSEEKKEYAIKKIRGIEKDSFLAKVAKAYMAILGDGKSGIFCENSLNEIDWSAKTKQEVKDETFDMVFTNPPFGSKIPVDDKQQLKNFNLGYEYKNDKKTNKLKSKVPPQILFIEKCINLARDGGKIAIILPEGILGNNRDKYIRQFILEKTSLFAVVDLPIETFQPYTATKTCVLFLVKKHFSEKDKIFFAMPETCGHDRRGKKIDSNEISEVYKKYRNFLN